MPSDRATWGLFKQVSTAKNNNNGINKNDENIEYNKPETLHDMFNCALKHFLQSKPEITAFIGKRFC